MTTLYIHPNDWIPSGVNSLDTLTDKVVRSNVNYSVIAGPGAGKTELLAQRACYLLQTRQCTYPRRVLAISFKKDSAENLKARVSERCHHKNASRFDSFTFDAFSKHMLDRFFKTLPDLFKLTEDYEIYFPKPREYSDFLIRLAILPENIHLKNRLLAIQGSSFEKNHILGSPLPIAEGNTTCIDFWAAMQWWKTCLQVGNKSRLTFPMIGKLVELILRTNPYICSALRATYSHVFMDEFQDTTHVQYELVKTAFLDSQTVLTAVGDNKQQIMRWAMALDDAFNDFEKDFGAQRIQLVSNHRSSSKLVEIQHHIACTIDSTSKKAISQKEFPILDDACVIWEFSTPQVEAEYLATYINSSVHSSQYIPRDFVLLVKQKVEDYANVLLPMFQSANVKARDESQIQEILAERLTIIIIIFLRFGSKSRAGIYWSDCCNVLKYLYGIDPENSRNGKSLQDKLNEFHSSLNERMKRLTKIKIRTKSLLEFIIDFIGQENIWKAYPEYKQNERFEDVIDKLADYLTQSCHLISNNDWNEVLDSFEGKDSVPIMTIHKSKGLEYQTVIFVGLEDSAWWSFANQPEESRSAFFVAFSRAKQRVIFTYCKQRGKKNKISSLYDILHGAGVNSEFIR
jgi:superfamily I DNA/RNA helicase